MDTTSSTTPARRWAFSLATLLRVTTLTSVVLGWVLLLPSAPPRIVVLVVFTLGAFLATIVGLRRFGSVYSRCKASVWFLAGTTVVAYYSGFIAIVIQAPVESTDPWAELNQFFYVVEILAGFPVIVATLVFMLRTWTWSANDLVIHKRLGGTD